MSLFSNLVSWASKSGVVQQAEQQAMAAVSSAVQQALTTAVSHAPDMQAQLEQSATTFLSHAIAGITTKLK